MKIVCLKGGLGNQLFEYCRYCQLKETGEDKVYMFYDFRKLKQHHGLLISQCFDISMPPKRLWVILLTLVIKLLRQCNLFPSLYDESNSQCVLIDSYCQDKRYINKSQELLKFKELPFTEQCKWYQSVIKAAQYPVAIHVRRGDYLQADNLDNIGVCETMYYQKAIDIVLKKHPEAQFFFFSDDMEWVRENLSVDNAIYREKDVAEHDYTDLYLMTLCKAHITANSTFSFWGSMLADHTDHLCIYPKHWFTNPEWTVPNIFPAHWIAI